jgi:DHA2 family multidrug resistance protein-like MFS transporter
MQTDIAEPNPNRWRILAACTLAAMVPAIGLSMIAFIAPAIQKNFGVPSSSMGLLVSIGLLVLSAFILGGGTLGDIYGRKRLLLIGLIGTIVASLLSAAAFSFNFLLGAQALAGISGALVSPLSLAIIVISFSSQERPRALGVFGGTTGLVVGLSILAIQWLNQSYGWRSAFSITILTGIVALILVLKILPESKSAAQNKVDWTGILLCAVGLIGIIYGINEANGPNGFINKSVMTPISLGIIMMCAFFWWEARIRYAALPFGLFLNRVFSVSMIINILMGLGLSGVNFQLSNYLQILLKLSPTASAMMMIPLALSMFAFSILGGLFIGRFGNRNVLLSGSIIAAIGVILMSRALSPNEIFWPLMIAEILLGLGLGIANTAQANVTLSVPPRELAGSASAANNAGQTLGSSLGIALLNTLFIIFGTNAYYQILREAGLNQSQIQNATMVLKQILASNVGSVASKYSIPVSRLEGLVGGFQQAYRIGLTDVLLIATVVFAICAVLTWFGIPKGSLDTKRSARKNK